MTASSTATVPSFDLAGKRALITGGSRGIGLAAAEALAAFGAHVTLLARPSADLNAAIERLKADGRSADALELDVKDTAGLRAAIAARAPYDVLVNNAGTNNPVTFLDVTEEQYDTIMTLNVRAAYFAAQAVAQKLAAAGRSGSIINVSSQMGHVGAATRTVYCASKWAMEGMTRAMAVDLAPHGIRVNTLCPTFIETPLARRMLANEQFRNEVLKKIKLGRLGQVGDLTGAIVYLASDASSLMTGTSMIIDGGWTAD
jgi:NAD(P)-dependent dehydrogenase (short-subunit alcohol dehydrogenase family)